MCRCAFGSFGQIRLTEMAEIDQNSGFSKLVPVRARTFKLKVIESWI